ncbi:hypothetical protein EVG20_g8050 [Dentipellis fragilis]|uniref:Uncharacterized protein n=1 Tax=Dentipellis fragilis TaxID=205917 RepID=A0A4Y9Y8M3_9AGAM|nr:hypothetical protein EVG20_g8050 [Dentipellis fragilis]
MDSDSDMPMGVDAVGAAVAVAAQAPARVPHIQIIVTPPLPSREDLPESMRKTLDAVSALQSPFPFLRASIDAGGRGIMKILSRGGPPVAERSQSQSSASDSVAGDGSVYYSFESESESESRCAHEKGRTCPSCKPSARATPNLLLDAPATPAHHEQTQRPPADNGDCRNQVVLRRARHVQRNDPARRYARYFSGDEMGHLLAAQAHSVAASSIRSGKSRNFPGLGILGSMTRTILGLRH